MRRERVKISKIVKNAGRGNNKGFSLPELLVALAIMVIVSGAILGFFGTSFGFYRSGSAESDLQNESQLVMTQLENLVLNASQGVGLGPTATSMQGGDLYAYNRVVDTGAISYRVTHIYQGDGTVGDSDKLYYCYMTYALDPSTGTYALSADKVDSKILAEYVSDFEVDVTNLLSKNSIVFTIDFDNQSKTYSAKKTVKLRNQSLALNGTPDDYFKDVIAADKENDVRSVTLSPGSFYMWAGTSAPNPFTATFTNAAGDSYSSGAQAVWTIEPAVAGALINRSTGALTLGSEVNSDLTVKATALSSINSSGGNSSLYVSGDATVYVKYITDAVLTLNPQDENNMRVKTATLTLNGRNFQPTEDLVTITPQVVEGLNLKPVITADSSKSSGSSLVYNVSLTRPSNYKDKTYTLKLRVSIGSSSYDAAVEVEFTGSDDNAKIVDVRLYDGENYYNGAGQVQAERGDIRNMQLQVRYEGQTGYETLSTEEWTIDSDSDKVSLVDSGSAYRASYNVADYASRIEVHLTTTYSDTDGSEKSGPSLTLVFNPITLKITGLPSNCTQSVFPVAKAASVQLDFTITGLNEGSIYVKSLDDSNLTVTASGTSATVKQKNSSDSLSTIVFGVENKKGTKISDVLCNISLKPGSANTCTSNGTAISGVYIPFVSEIKTFNSSLSSPASGQTVTLYTLDGKPIVYKNEIKSVNGTNRQYWVTYDGKTYYYNANARKWYIYS